MKNLRSNSRIGRSPVFLAILLFAVMLPSEVSRGGSGTFRNGEFDFCVSVRFNATAAQLQQIKTAFENGSQILADATDGQHKFGTVRIVNNSGSPKSAEYWVNAGPGRAYATLGQYGIRGEHVNLYFESDFQQTSGADGDAYTIAHEHAHHAYGVLDEYSGPSGNAECAAPPDTATLNYCLMDNYFTRGGRSGTGTTYTLNEFCVASNHDPDVDTYQESVHGESCWETISSHPTRSATAPTGLPEGTSPAAHSITFEDGLGGLAVMLLLDRSGSMSSNDRMTFAKLGAKQFIDLLEVDDGVGVASFSSSASVNFALTSIVGDSTKNAAKTAVDSLSPSELTNIGGGLLAALGQFTAQTHRSCNEIIVLLSDGDHNTGTAPSAVIPNLQEEGITVLTVGVGSGISPSGQSNLEQVASDTGGKYYRVANSSDLTAAFVQLAAETTGSGLLTRSPLAIASGETRTVPVLVEPDTEQVSFAITFADASDSVQLSLKAPSGMVITPADATTNPNIDYGSSSHSQVFKVTSPEAGSWDMILSAGTVNTGQVQILAFAQHGGVDLNVWVKKSSLAYPEPMEIAATPTYEGEAVLGADITGVVVHPDGSQVPIVLYDDGLASHADVIADDGTYGMRFTSYTEDGTYIFELKVESSGDQTYSGESIFASEPVNTKVVPTFTRTASASAVITGIPEFVVAALELGPEVINLKSQGNFLTAYIELEDGFNPSDIAVTSVAITAIDQVSISPVAALPKPTELGDFDSDGIPDLMVKFPRQALSSLLEVGVREIRVEGNIVNTAGTRPFRGERSVLVINPGKTVGVHQLRSRGVYFYTADEAKRDSLLSDTSSEWGYDGIVYRAYANQAMTNLTPVYWFHSTTLNQYLYIISEAEKDRLVDLHGDIWTYQGVAFYVFPEGQQPGDALPVYDMWSESLGTHLYTISESEKDRLLRKQPDMWDSVEIAWYAYKK